MSKSKPKVPQYIPANVSEYSWLKRKYRVVRKSPRNPQREREREREGGSCLGKNIMDTKKDRTNAKNELVMMACHTY